MPAKVLRIAQKPGKVLPFAKPQPKPDPDDQSTWSPTLLKRMDVLQAICFSPDPLLTDCMAACLTADAETLARVYWLLSNTERSVKP